MQGVEVSDTFLTNYREACARFEKISNKTVFGNDRGTYAGEGVNLCTEFTPIIDGANSSVSVTGCDNVFCVFSLQGNINALQAQARTNNTFMVERVCMLSGVLQAISSGASGLAYGMTANATAGTAQFPKIVLTGGALDLATEAAQRVAKAWNYSQGEQIQSTKGLYDLTVGIFSLSSDISSDATSYNGTCSSRSLCLSEAQNRMFSLRSAQADTTQPNQMLIELITSYQTVNTTDVESVQGNGSAVIMQLKTSLPTPAPTPAPTSAPTPEPTMAPTVSPTAAPTAQPTSAPTASPTSAPTAQPTSAPTAQPTSAPTASPTRAPTPAPTPEQSSDDLAGVSPLVGAIAAGALVIVCVCFCWRRYCRRRKADRKSVV